MAGSPVTGIWTKNKVDGRIEFGTKHEDGSKVLCFAIDPRQYGSQGEVDDAVAGAFHRFGIDVSRYPAWRQRNAADDLLRARQQALHEALLNSGVFGRAMPGSMHYAPFGFGGDTAGSAFFDDHAADALNYSMGGRREGKTFEERDFGRFQDKATPPNPERIKAVARCRSLKTLADHASANPGEAANARAALDRLQAKHSIKDSEI